MSTFEIDLEKNADGEYVMPTGGIANFYFTEVDEHADDDVDDMLYGPRGGLHDLKPVAENWRDLVVMATITLRTLKRANLLFLQIFKTKTQN